MDRPNEEQTSLFTFITSEEFKRSLESDYAELMACMGAKAWKAVHVLAGSIIEAVLIDYLVATNTGPQSKEDLLKMELGPAIEACKRAKVLTPNTAHLSLVVKDFRNLIHPGRIARLNERVDADGAVVASSLVRMVVKDVARQRQKVYGYTAEQIVSKVNSDLSSALAILPHLLKEINDAERRRLLLDVLPTTMVRNYAQSGPDDWCNAYEECYRLTFDQASPETKEEATARYVSVLKEQGKSVREVYDSYFFRAKDLQFLSSSADVELVKHHLFDLLRKSYIYFKHEVTDGIGKFITVEDVLTERSRVLWIPILDLRGNESRFTKALHWHNREWLNMTGEVPLKYSGDIACHISHYTNQGKADLAATVTRLLESMQTPF